MKLELRSGTFYAWATLKYPPTARAHRAAEPGAAVVSASAAASPSVTTIASAVVVSFSVAASSRAQALGASDQQLQSFIGHHRHGLRHRGQAKLLARSQVGVVIRDQRQV